MLTEAKVLLGYPYVHTSEVCSQPRALAGVGLREGWGGSVPGRPTGSEVVVRALPGWPWVVPRLLTARGSQPKAQRPVGPFRGRYIRAESQRSNDDPL